MVSDEKRKQLTEELEVLERERYIQYAVVHVVFSMCIMLIALCVHGSEWYTV